MPDPPLPLDDAGRRRLEPLLSREWALSGHDHPLGRLQGQSLGPCRLLVLLGPKNNVGARYFQLFLVNEQGRLTHEALAFGLHSSGPFPGYNWIELTRYQGAPTFDPLTGSGQAGEILDLAAEGLDRRLFRLLSQLVPPGGHLMVEYESPSQRESERVLGLGYPPVTTPLGHLLFQAGCRSFRDWYISEGGREGPRKLQGFKPLNGAVAQAKAEEMRRELSDLLARPEAPPHGERGLTARRLAQAILRALEREQGTGNREQGSAGPPVP